jgi:glucose-6-phosphate isomerase
MWNDLKTMAGDVADRPILDLFDDARADDFAVQTQFMRFDYAKTNIDAATRAALLALADKAGVAARRDAMFAGAKINETEGRAVLHTALRSGHG